MGLKRGFVFTADVLIGVSLFIVIFFTIAFFEFESILPEKRYEKLNYIAEDTMDSLAYLKARDIQDKPTVNQLIEEGALTDRDLEKSVLDLIASFWYAGNKTIAGNISEEFLEVITEDVCVNLNVDGEIMYSSCPIPGKEVAVATRIESGYKPGKPAFGYIARAFLTSIRGKRDSSYAYFGGFVGEGNITRIITLPPFDTILEAYMELNPGNSFNLSINGEDAGFYINGSAGGGHMRADKWVVCNLTYNPDYCSNFTEGENTLQFNFTGNNSFIGGGYFRVTYNTTKMAPPEEVGVKRYWFPEIHGFINLYSSFYVPGTLTDMSAYLHYYNNITGIEVPVYLTIGNVTVFESNATTEQKVTISDDDISGNFTGKAKLVDTVSKKTVPIRMGIKEIAFTKTGEVDVVLVTDRSWSMEWCMNNNVTGKPVENYSITNADDCENSCSEDVGVCVFSSKTCWAWGKNVDYDCSGDPCCNNCQPDCKNPVRVSFCDKNVDPCCEEKCENLTDVPFCDKGVDPCCDGPFCKDYVRVSFCDKNVDPCCKYPVCTDNQTKVYYPCSGDCCFYGGCDNLTNVKSCSYAPGTCCWGYYCENMIKVKSCSYAPGTCCWGPYYENKTEVSECLPEYDKCWCEPPPTEKCYKEDRYYKEGDKYYKEGDKYYWKYDPHYENGMEYYTLGDQYYQTGDEYTKCWLWDTKSEPYCSQCDPKRILLAKKLDKIFVSDILDAPNSRVGLVGYGSTVCDKTDLSANKPPLISTINDYDADCGHTCISCAVQNGTEILNESDATNKYLVVMSDGDANCLIDGSCGTKWEDEAIQEAIDKSCEAWDNYGIKVYTIGFGKAAGEETLKNMSECGNGEFYKSSDAAELESIYKEIAEEILAASYRTQEVNITGNITFNNILYPDSYIEMNYTSGIEPIKYAEISLTRDTERLENFTGDDVDIPYKEGWYNISEQVRVIDAKITSYSSEYWTDRLNISNSLGVWTKVYWLGDYGSHYQELGDPFIVQIPAELISSGNNSVRVGTGLSTDPANATGGSPDDRVIYTMAIEGAVGWGEVNETMKCAIDDAIKRLNDTVSDYVDFSRDDAEITSSSIRGIRWLWGPSLLKTVVWEK